LNYPPFSRLVSLLLDGPRGEEVESRAQNLAAFLREKRAKNSKFRDQVEVLGPAPAPLQKLRNRYRWHLLLKGKKISSLLELASQAREAFPPARVVRLHVDVDPYSML
jgi:primosomal protein N' (replication factor Y)